MKTMFEFFLQSFSRLVFSTVIGTSSEGKVLGVKISERRGWGKKNLLRYDEKEDWYISTDSFCSKKISLFVVLTCHKPVLDRFGNHFQATVHFPLSSKVVNKFTDSLTAFPSLSISPN